MRFGKSISFVLVIILSIFLPSGLNINALDDESALSINSNPIPQMMYINQTITKLTISSSGEAVSIGQIIGNTGITDTVWIYLYLEKFENYSWTTVSSCNKSFTYYRGELRKTDVVSSGYYYRVRASYYAFSGLYCENIVKYSNSVYY